MSTQSWRKRSMSLTDIPNDLPVNNPTSAVARKESSRSAMAHKMIHLIPVVVVFCFVILWSFASPVKFETNNGVTRFVSLIKTSQPDIKQHNVDESMTSLETPRDDFLTISESPTPPPSPLPQHSKLSLLEIHDENASLTGSPNASLTDSGDHSKPLSESQVPNESFSFEDSTEPKTSYPKRILEIAPESGEEADQDSMFL